MKQASSTRLLLHMFFITSVNMFFHTMNHISKKELEDAVNQISNKKILSKKIKSAIGAQNSKITFPLSVKTPGTNYHNNNTLESKTAQIDKYNCFSAPKILVVF